MNTLFYSIDHESCTSCTLFLNYSFIMYSVKSSSFSHTLLSPAPRPQIFMAILACLWTLKPVYPVLPQKWLGFFFFVGNTSSLQIDIERTEF